MPSSLIVATAAVVSALASVKLRPVTVVAVPNVVVPFVAAVLSARLELTLPYWVVAERVLVALDPVSDAAVMLKVLLVAPVSPVAAAVNV